jgi:hypothetical protein
VAKVKVKNVRVWYGLFGQPHSQNIEKATRKWVSKGYELQSRDEQPSGCLGVRRGHTELLFVLREESK